MTNPTSDIVRRLRQASLHLEQPHWNTAVEHPILQAVRKRQQRGRSHRLMLMSACGALALVMLLFVQLRSAEVGQARPQERSSQPVQPGTPPAPAAILNSPATNSSIGVASDGAVNTRVSDDRVSNDQFSKDRTAKESKEGIAPRRLPRATPEHSADIEPARVNIDDLWELVDHQRGGGHYDQSITTLKTLLAQYPKDSRAFLAAFTLGRILESAGKQPERVVRAFERSYQLSPKGPLAQDSLRQALRVSRTIGNPEDIKRLEERWKTAFGQLERSSQQ